MTESDCFRIYFFYFISIESGESAMPSRDGVYHGALCISPPPPPPMHTVSNCGASYQLPHDAWKEQWEEDAVIEDCEAGI